MTKEQMMQIMRLLSGLEAIGLMQDVRLPAYLIEQIDAAVEALEREILK